MNFSPLTLFGLFAVTAMLVCYALESRSPWFILGFLIAAALVTWVPGLESAGHVVEWTAKRLFVLTLFLIGAGLTKSTLKAVGIKPLAQGVILWMTVAVCTLSAISLGWID